jgi:replicative DNA helicase
MVRERMIDRLPPQSLEAEQSVLGASLIDRDAVVEVAECLRRGVVKAVNKIYVSLAHTDADLDETLGVFDEALAAVKRRTS